MAIAASYPTIKPSLLLDFANAKAVDPRVTFVRSTTGTFYDGVTTAKAEENLFERSQEFDNAYWTKTRLTITANTTTAPDGTSTAESAIPTAEALGHRFSRNVTVSSSGDLVWSIFAKANGYNFIAINARSGATDRNCFFNISTGTVATNSSGGTASIVDAGNGWYRCSVVRASEGATAVNEFSVCETDNVASFTANGTDGIYVWGAQLEQRSAVTAYTPTTTQPITNYIPVLQTAAAGVPRIDHNPVTGECLGLLIEEQRVNLLTYSEQFDNAAWTKTRSSITANTVVAPDGTLTGDKLVEDTTASSTHILQIDTSLGGSVDSSAYTITIYAKAGERSRFRLRDVFQTTSGSTVFDLTNGTVVTGTGAISSVGNDWYRCSIFPLKNLSTTSRLEVALVDSGTNATYTGDGYSGVYIWGAQLEAGAFPTSYIPTVATQETRNADAASMTGTNFSSWYNAGEGTIYVDYYEATPANVSTAGFSISDNTNDNRISFFSDGLSSSLIQPGLFITANGLAQTASPAGITTQYTNNKFAGAYKFNDVSQSINGDAVVPDTTVTLPTVNRAFIGASQTGNSSFINSTIKKIAYYPQRLSDTNLQALTA